MSQSQPYREFHHVPVIVANIIIIKITAIIIIIQHIMPVLSFTLSPDGVVRIHDAILCLAKFSETVSLEAHCNKVGDLEVLLFLACALMQVSNSSS